MRDTEGGMGEELSGIEERRLRQIAENEARLELLGLGSGAGKLTDSGRERRKRTSKVYEVNEEKTAGLRERERLVLELLKRFSGKSSMLPKLELVRVGLSSVTALPSARNDSIAPL